MSCSYSALWIVIVCLARLGTFAYGEVKRECAKVTTWAEFVDTIQNSSASDKVMFCPFSVQHNGESSSGFNLPSGKTIICQKLNAMDQCIIQGDSRHFDISSNTLIGFTFSSSKYSAVMLDGAQTRVDFIGCNFVNNVRLDGGDGGAITTNNTVKDEPADTGTSTIFIALSTFIANGAPFGHGGALFTTDSQVMVISSDFINNSANIGGAIAIKNGSFRDTTFTYNHSNDAFTSSGYSISLNTCSIGYNLGCNFKKINECDGIYSGGSICKKFETVCEYPSTQPTKASSRPSSSPSLRRSLAPSMSSSHSAKPTDIPTFLLTESPTILPSTGPSSSTTLRPSTESSELPTIISMPSPTFRNVPSPYSAKPAESPSLVPTDSPSTSSIHVPTILTLSTPSGLPSIIATPFPSLSRVFTSSPSSILTDADAPSLMPILSPTVIPSVAESGSPSISSPSPSNEPSLSLTVKPKFVCENLLDSKDEFNVSFELGVRTCDWVMRSSETVETCAIPIVEKNCPVTCSVDCINDQGIWSKAEQSTDEKYKKDKEGSLKRNIIIISSLTLLFVAGVSYYLHNKRTEDDASELGFMDLFRAFSFENFFRMIGYDRSMGSSSSSSKNSYISDDESSTSSSSSPVASHVSSHDRFFFPRKTAKSFVSISESPSSTSDAKPASSLCCA